MPHESLPANEPSVRTHYMVSDSGMRWLAAVSDGSLQHLSTLSLRTSGHIGGDIPSSSKKHLASLERVTQSKFQHYSTAWAKQQRISSH